MRLVDTGEILFKEQIGGNNGDLVSAFLADLYNVGTLQLIIVLRNGQSNICGVFLKFHNFIGGD